MLALVIALALAAAPRPAPGERPASKPAPPPLPAVEAKYEHELTTPNGVVPLTWPSLSYDPAYRELFLVAEGFVRIFDASGMEVHRFGDDGSLGQISRAAVLADGEIVLLTTIDRRRAYLRCDFRGELIARFGLTGLPEAFDDFDPDQLVYRDGSLYFAERGRMRVVVTDVTGGYRQSFDLGALVAAAVPANGDRKPATNMDGFNVDARGNLLFTMSTMFAAGVVSRAGELRFFGSRGSRPGKFNIIGGIDSDEAGNLYVTDRLRSVVSVWDGELRHLGDFGYRGSSASNLLAPYEIAVGNGRVFVAQAGKRGVKVFRVRLVEPEPPAPPGKSPPKPPLRMPPRGTAGLG